MKKITATALLLLISLASFSQLRIEAGYGYATYSLNDLRDLNTEFLKGLPVEAKITDDFPAQPYFSAGIFYHPVGLFYVGVTGQYYTTGSRISYKDYSGELKIDNLLTSYAPGMAVGIVLMDTPWQLVEETRVSYSLTTLKINEKIITSTDDATFKSSGLQVEPRFRLAYRINQLEVGLHAGYAIDFGGNNRLADNKDAVLQFPQSKEEITTRWSGMRLGASIGYCFQFR